MTVLAKLEGAELVHPLLLHGGLKAGTTRLSAAHAFHLCLRLDPKPFTELFRFLASRYQEAGDHVIRGIIVEGVV